MSPIVLAMTVRNYASGRQAGQQSSLRRISDQSALKMRNRGTICHSLQYSAPPHRAVELSLRDPITPACCLCRCPRVADAPLLAPAGNAEPPPAMHAFSRDVPASRFSAGFSIRS
jgi:hypothetical protein